MAIHKYKDWRGWLDGLRSKVMRAGAEGVVTQFSAWFGTNALASAIPALQDSALNLKQAGLLLVTQVGIRCVWSAALYVQNKPDPDVVEERTTSDVP